MRIIGVKFKVYYGEERFTKIFENIVDEKIKEVGWKIENNEMDIHGNLISGEDTKGKEVYN